MANQPTAGAKLLEREPSDAMLNSPEIVHPDAARIVWERMWDAALQSLAPADGMPPQAVARWIEDYGSVVSEAEYDKLYAHAAALARKVEEVEEALRAKDRDRHYHMDAINRLASFLAFHGTSFEVIEAAIANIKRLAGERIAAESTLATVWEFRLSVSELLNIVRVLKMQWEPSSTLEGLLIKVGDFLKAIGRLPDRPCR